jgi:hypothetical protein
MATDVYGIQSYDAELDVWMPVGWDLSEEEAVRKMERFKKDFSHLRIKHWVEAVEAKDRVGDRGVILEWQRSNHGE